MATDPGAPPVVLVHGWGGSFSTTWQRSGFSDLLADAGRQVIGVDLLGHGDAPKPHDPEAYAELEDRVMAELPDEPVDAIAFSMGARVTLVLASRAPERFNRIVVAGVGANLFRVEERGSLILQAIAGEGTPDDPVASYFGSLADAPGSDREALVALLKCPRPPLT